jgi:hypothetical protein
VIEVASWRLQSTAAGDDRRAPVQKHDYLLARSAKPASLARGRAHYAVVNAMTAQDFRASSTDVAARNKENRVWSAAT